MCKRWRRRWARRKHYARVNRERETGTFSLSLLCTGKQKYCHQDYDYNFDLSNTNLGVSKTKSITLGATCLETLATGTRNNACSIESPSRLGSWLLHMLLLVRNQGNGAKVMRLDIRGIWLYVCFVAKFGRAGCARYQVRTEPCICV